VSRRSPPPPPTPPTPPDDDDDLLPAGSHSSLRLDKWLWAARFYKTRSLAADEVGRGRVMVNGQLAKPAREVRRGDRLSLRQGNAPVPREVVVQGLSATRGPAPVARLLYEETPESLAAQAQWAAERRLHTEPALSIEQGRPTKAARRQLADWQRWSVSLDDGDGNAGEDD
jgi:ribosome-associated heat shock protein Hsp15